MQVVNRGVATAPGARCTLSGRWVFSRLGGCQGCFESLRSAWASRLPFAGSFAAGGGRWPKSGGTSSEA